MRLNSIMNNAFLGNAVLMLFCLSVGGAGCISYLGNGKSTSIVISGSASRLFAKNDVVLKTSFFKPQPVSENSISRSQDGYIVKVSNKLDSLTFLKFIRTSGEVVSFILINGSKLRDARDLSIVLNKPQPWIEIESAVEGKRFIVKYAADIDEDNIRWTTLPYWDASKEVLTNAANPELKISYANDPSKVLLTVKMNSFCSGLYWFSRVKLPDNVKAGEVLNVTVVQDTGDLFGKIEGCQKLTIESKGQLGP